MTFLAIQRETIMILALASLTVAGVVFAAGALTLFVRERRRSVPMAPVPDPSDPPAPREGSATHAPREDSRRNGLGD